MGVRSGSFALRQTRTPSESASPLSIARPCMDFRMKSGDRRLMSDTSACAGEADQRAHKEALSRLAVEYRILTASR